MNCFLEFNSGLSSGLNNDLNFSKFITQSFCTASQRLFSFCTAWNTVELSSFYGPFWQLDLTLPILIYFHYIEKSGHDILRKLTFCIPLKVILVWVNNENFIFIFEWTVPLRACIKATALYTSRAMARASKSLDLLEGPFLSSFNPRIVSEVTSRNIMIYMVTSVKISCMSWLKRFDVFFKTDPNIMNSFKKCDIDILFLIKKHGKECSYNQSDAILLS